MTIACLFCGSAVGAGSARMRLFATPDSSVRTTSIIAHFHTDCGVALVDELANRRRDEPRQVWGRGPRSMAMPA